MIYIVSSYEYNENVFSLKEIYVSSGESMYVLSKDSGFLPFSTVGNVVDVYDASKNSVFPLVGFSEIRVYDGDDDAGAFSKFLYSKIKETNFSHPDADKALFNVISSFGDEYVQTPI